MMVSLELSRSLITLRRVDCEKIQPTGLRTKGQLQFQQIHSTIYWQAIIIKTQFHTLLMAEL